MEMKMCVVYCIYFCFIFYLQVKCEDKNIESKNPLPYFRRQVEEISEDITTIRSSTVDTRSDSNLVSFLIKNVKKIFSELNDIEQSEMIIPISTEVLPTAVYVNSTTAGLESSFLESFSSNNNTTFHHRSKHLRLDYLGNTSTTSTYLYKLFQYTTLKRRNFSEKDFVSTESSSASNELTSNEELMHLSKNLIFFETDRRQRDNNLNYYAHNASYYPSASDTSLRSCIFCNNVLLENCNDPRNRLIPSTVCERDDDVCYSQHTPFGVIDRGCYNVNHNLTTYVCSCNLCNYISISEMPYVFATKRDWVDNVVELSRTRHLRKSVFKDMTCLKCESNASSKTGDMLATANCLEGNIGSLATEVCEENEVCAVKAIKHDGYLWRGCVKEPLFNYWWAYCDSDLCNYDIVTSIYDID